MYLSDSYATLKHGIFLAWFSVNNDVMNLASRQLVKFWIDQITEYARNVEKLQIDPLPKIELIGAEEKKCDKNDLLISTGGYVPALKTIVLYIDNRHLKDILRSFCHELVHHNQNLDNSDYIRRVFNQPQDLAGNLQLEEIEGDAYLRGNLLFRKFTEWFKRQQRGKEND